MCQLLVLDINFVVDFVSRTTTLLEREAQLDKITLKWVTSTNQDENQITAKRCTELVQTLAVQFVLCLFLEVVCLGARQFDYSPPCLSTLSVLPQREVTAPNGRHTKRRGHNDIIETSLASGKFQSPCKKCMVNKS